MIADMEANSKLNPIVTELISRGKKLSISLIFVLQCYLKVPRTVRIKQHIILRRKYLPEEKFNI